MRRTNKEYKIDLTKFLPNSKAVLNIILVEDKTKSVGEEQLTSWSIPAEPALGVPRTLCQDILIF